MRLTVSTLTVLVGLTTPILAEQIDTPQKAIAAADADCTASWGSPTADVARKACHARRIKDQWKIWRGKEADPDMIIFVPQNGKVVPGQCGLTIREDPKPKG